MGLLQGNTKEGIEVSTKGEKRGLTEGVFEASSDQVQCCLCRSGKSPTGLFLPSVSKQ